MPVATLLFVRREMFFILCHKDFDLKLREESENYSSL